MTKEILTNSLENEMDFWEQLENQEYKRKSLHKFKPSNQNERTMFELIIR